MPPIPLSAGMRPHPLGALATLLVVAGLVSVVPIAAATPPGSALPTTTSDSRAISNPTVAVTASPLSGTVPLNVSFVATGTNGTTPYTVVWSFGDGSSPGVGLAVSHVFMSAGTFTTRANLTDYYGATANATVEIVVGPPPLVVGAQAVPATLAVGASTLLETSVSGGTAPYSFSWSGLPPGCPNQSIENYSCEPTAGGSYTITVTVTDHAGASAHASFALIVTGGGPTGGGTSPSGGSVAPVVLVVLAIGAAIAAVAGLLIGRRFRRRSKP